MPSPPNQDTMQDNEPEAPAATVTSHPYGDTRLLLCNSSGAEIVFVVDSKIMMLVCTVWSRMLAPDGHFIESKAPESGMREISFPDDDPDTLTILLNIAHLRFNMVPNSVGLKTLVNLAVLTDKYGAEGLLSPWLGVWMEPYITKYAPPGWEELLYVCWAFGYAETFGDLSSKLVMELGLNDEGKPVTPDKIVLDADDGLHFPPSMIGKSKKAPTSISLPDASLSTQRAKKDG